MKLELHCRIRTNKGYHSMSNLWVNWTVPLPVELWPEMKAALYKVAPTANKKVLPSQIKPHCLYFLPSILLHIPKTHWSGHVIPAGSFPNQIKILVIGRDIFTSGTASQCGRLTERHLPETVDSVLRVVELDCRAGSQIQGSDWLLTLQQRHSCISSHPLVVCLVWFEGGEI